MTSHRLPPKKDVALELLRRTSLFIHLDPRLPGVMVPEWFKKQPQLVLQVGFNMAVPIRDLTVDDEGISGTLSFNRSPFFCHVPWASIFALMGDNHRGMVWPDFVPPEIAAHREHQARVAAEQARVLDARAKLRVVPADAPAEAAPPPQPAAPPAAKKPKRRQAPAAPGDEPKRPARRKATAKSAAVARPDGEPSARPQPKKTAAAVQPSAEAAAPKPKRRRPVAPPTPSATAAAPAEPPATSTSASATPKRSLPPYLRVVK